MDWKLILWSLYVVRKGEAKEIWYRRKEIGFLKLDFIVINKFADSWLRDTSTISYSFFA